MVSRLRTGVVAPWTTAPRTANPNSGTGAPATARDAPCGPAHRREGRVRRALDVLMLIELWNGLTVDEAAGGPPRVTTSDPRSTGSLAQEGSPAHRGRVSSEPVGVSPRGGEHSCGARRPDRLSRRLRLATAAQTLLSRGLWLQLKTRGERSRLSCMFCGS